MIVACPIEIGDARRIDPAPGAIVAGIGEQLTRLRPAPARIEHRRGRLVGEELIGCLQPPEQTLMDRPKQEGQAAVDTKHHIVVANAVTNRGHDRSHLLEMAKAAQAEIGGSEMIVLADHGYYEGEQIRSCAEAGIIPMVPKPNTSPAQARGFWGKTMFVHEPETDTYRCPAGQHLQKRFARVEGGKLTRPSAHD